MQQPKYAVLMQALQADIQNGVYAVGEKLPSEHELAAAHSLSRQTVRQALAKLENDGWIEKRQGSGSVVRATGQPVAGNGNIAVITTYIGEYIFPDMLRGIEEVLSQNGETPLLAATQNRIDNESRILRDLVEKGAKAILVEGTKTAIPNPNVETYLALHRSGMPIVFVHGFYPELRECVHVVADDRQGGADAVNALYAKGYRHLCGIFKSDDMQGHRRYAGYAAALQAKGLAFNDDRVLWFSTETREKVIRGGLAELVQGCDALVCYNDEVAVLALEILQSTGLRVPEDIALVSFDNSRYSEIAGVKISSFAGDESRVGRMAAEKLLGLLRGEKQESEILPWRLEERQSF